MKLQFLKTKSKATEEKETIIDINGEERLAKDCQVRLEGSYHDKNVKKVYVPIINSDTPPAREDYLYYVDFGRRGLRLSNSRRIAWIDFQNSWILADPGQSFVDVLYLKDGKVGTGKTLYDPYVTVHAINGSGEEVFIVDHNTALGMGYVPSRSDNRYHSPSLKAHDRRRYAELVTRGSFNLPIRTNHHADETNECYNRVVELFEKVDYPAYTKETRYMNRLLAGKTFGIEYEVVNGTIPSPMLGQLGVTALTDGSIGRSNYEITTVPLAGIKGLEAVRFQCAALTNQAQINTSCALHIHIGNVANDKLTFLALYSLFHRLQEDIYACHPYYKQYEIGTLGKNKEYSRRLPDVGLKRNTIFASGSKEAFQEEVAVWHKKLFEYFACTEETSEHNRGQRGEGRRTVWGAKWHCPTRYYWSNFINYLFSKSGTIEFRIHEPTTNYVKVTNFLLLCVALVRYAETYPERILRYKQKITLDDVLEELRTNFTGTELKGRFGSYCNEITDYMKEYILNRENTFAKQLNKANRDSAVNHNSAFGNIGNLTKKMLKGDAGFKFEFNGRSSLY